MHTIMWRARTTEAVHSGLGPPTTDCSVASIGFKLAHHSPGAVEIDGGRTRQQTSMTCERTKRLVHAHSGTPQCWGGLARIGERSALGRLEANHSSSGVDVTLPRETCNRNRGFVRTQWRCR